MSAIFLNNPRIHSTHYKNKSLQKSILMLPFSKVPSILFTHEACCKHNKLKPKILEKLMTKSPKHDPL